VQVNTGKFHRKINEKKNILDQLIGDLLEGISGRIIWGIIQLFLMILGNIGKYMSNEPCMRILKERHLFNREYSYINSFKSSFNAERRS
jgi:hypothetical protein